MSSYLVGRPIHPGSEGRCARNFLSHPGSVGVHVDFSGAPPMILNTRVTGQETARSDKQIQKSRRCELIMDV